MPSASQIAAFLLLAFCGCARYAPLPLTRQVVHRELAPPPVDQIRVAANQVEHPILRPIQYDPSDGFSPDELAILAVLVNPKLRAARDRRELAGAQLLQARLLPNPQLAWNMDFPTGGLTAGTVDAYGLGVNWDITSLIGYAARVDAASVKPVAVALDVAWQEWAVAESAKIATYALIGLEQQATLAEQLDDQLLENLTTIQQAVANGLKTELDLAAAGAASTQAHAVFLGLRSQIALKRIELNRLLGLPAKTVVSLQAGLDLPSEFTPPPVAMLMTNLERRRLDLVGLRYGYLSQEATLRAAVLAQFPKVSLGVLNARDTGDVVTTGFGASIDVPLFDRNQGVIGKERVTRRKLLDEYVNRYFETSVDVARLRTRAVWLNRQIKTAQLAEAKQRELVDIYQIAVDKGQADVVVYYAARATLTQRQIDTVKLRQRLMQTRIELELAAGIFNIDSMVSSEKLEEIPTPDAVGQ